MTSSSPYREFKNLVGTMGCDELGRTTGDEGIALAIKLFYVDVLLALDKRSSPEGST